MDDSKKKALKQIPKIDELLDILKSRGVPETFSKSMMLRACRETAEEIRKAVLEKGSPAPSENEVADRVQQKLRSLYSCRLKPVVNATGIILHTNLGRAPLCREALDNIIAVARGYANLEFDLEEGKRGSRYDHVRDILCELSGAEDALVVNNNAAAVLLAVNTIAAHREVIVSRGELIEIGGEFRLPEVMEKSGAILKEVGTTNKTHAADYEKAIGDHTGLLFKAHTSNYKIIGFAGEVGMSELAAIGKKYGIPVMHDLGSGCFVELDRFGLEREPTVQDAVATGMDVITFSGDKLLGGPQAGIIVGRREWIQKIAQNPLNRALRIDKLTIAALEATLNCYLSGDQKAASHIPTLKALTEPVEDVEKRGRKLLRQIKGQKIEDLSLSLRRDYSMAGGGSLPGQLIPTILIAIHAARISPNRFEAALRHLSIPVIARISEDELLLDVRTLPEETFPIVLGGLREIMHAL